MASNNLPLTATSFVGRARLLADVERLLAAGPLVTLLGPGGAGKTRCAVEYAWGASARFPAGVRQVDLAEVRAPGRVAADVAAVLGVTAGAGDVAELVAEQVGDRRMLLVLDTCEHVVDPLARLVHRLVITCRQLRVLCTSRRPLGLAAEVTLPVGPLGREDAVSLLVDRDRAADPGFVPDDPASLAAVCERLDDLPLAIELAAPWVRIAATADLPALAGRADLGAATRRDLPARQQTMRATVQWSHDLLTGDEQVLLRRLAVFHGSADLAAVTAVCAGGCLPPDRIGPLVARLAEQSVLAVVRPSAGRVRYRLLDVVRDLATEQLAAAGEVPELGRRHFAHHLASAGRVDAARRRSGADATVAELVADADNHRAALEWGLRHDPPGALRLAVALEAFWMVCSVGEGREWLLQALERAPGATLDRARALVVPPLVVAGGLPWERVRPMIGTAEEIFTAHGDGPGAALARQTLVLSAFFHGRLAEALRASEAPVRDGPPSLRARAAVYRGTVLAYTPRRMGEGCRLLATGLDAAQEVGDGWGAGLASTMLGLADLRSGRPDAAWPRLAAALSGRLQAGVTAAALGGTAQLALARDPRLTLTLLDAAEALRDRSGVPCFPVPVAAQLAGVRAAAIRRVAPAVRQDCRRRGRAWTTGEALTAARHLHVPGPLTGRQQEVALLAAAGRSNREIAQRLGLSVRTVESHVSAALTRLGLRSRVQLADWARETDPVP